MKRALITGTAGFIGFYLAKLLMAKGRFATDELRRHHEDGQISLHMVPSLTKGYGNMQRTCVAGFQLQHGSGRSKAGSVAKLRSSMERDLRRSLKLAFDPKTRLRTGYFCNSLMSQFPCLDKAWKP